MKQLQPLSQSGMSLIEFLVGILVLGIFILGLSTLLNFSAERTKKMTVKVSGQMDAMLAERFLYNDLRVASFSLNNLATRDDLGAPFFDYIPDVPANGFVARRDRILTLSRNSTRRDFVIIRLDTSGSVGTSVMYDPVSAYNIGASPANMSTPAPMTFVSLNRNNYVNQLAPGLWVNGKVLMLDTPAMIRPVVNRQVDMRMPPRSPIYIGRVQETALVRLSHPDFKMIHPSYDFPPPNPDIRQINTVDEFLRWLPPVGGTVPVVRVSPVQILRYSIQNSTANPEKVDLYREVFREGAWVERQVIAPSIWSLVLQRESIMSPLISFVLHINDPARGTEL